MLYGSQDCIHYKDSENNDGTFLISGKHGYNSCSDQDHYHQVFKLI